MTNGRVEIITSVQRRRRWRSAEKRPLVAASLEAGASVSAIAREAGIHLEPAVWLATAAGAAGISFAPVRIAPEDARAGLSRSCSDRDRVCERSADADHGGGRTGRGWRRRLRALAEGRRR